MAKKSGLSKKRRQERKKRHQYIFAFIGSIFAMGFLAFIAFNPKSEQANEAEILNGTGVTAQQTYAFLGSQLEEYLGKRIGEVTSAGEFISNSSRPFDFECPINGRLVHWSGNFAEAPPEYGGDTRFTIFDEAVISADIVIIPGSSDSSAFLNDMDDRDLRSRYLGYIELITFGGYDDRSSDLRILFKELIGHVASVCSLGPVHSQLVSLLNVAQLNATYDNYAVFIAIASQNDWQEWGLGRYGSFPGIVTIGQLPSCDHWNMISRMAEDGYFTNASDPLPLQQLCSLGGGQK